MFLKLYPNLPCLQRFSNICLLIGCTLSCYIYPRPPWEGQEYSNQVCLFVRITPKLYHFTWLIVSYQVGLYPWLVPPQKMIGIKTPEFCLRFFNEISFVSHILLIQSGSYFHISRGSTPCSILLKDDPDPQWDSRISLNTFCQYPVPDTRVKDLCSLRHYLLQTVEGREGGGGARY